MEKEFYEEYEDMEAGIDQKQALVEESKKVDEIEDFSEAVRFVNDLKKRWRKTGFGESLAEEKLREEFDANIEKVYEKQKALAQKVVDVKEALIKEAEKTSLSDDFKKATEKMTSLMDQWKVSGNAGKKTVKLLQNGLQNPARRSIITWPKSRIFQRTEEKLPV